MMTTSEPKLANNLPVTDGSDAADTTDSSPATLDTLVPSDTAGMTTVAPATVSLGRIHARRLRELYRTQRAGPALTRLKLSCSQPVCWSESPPRVDTTRCD